MSMERIDVLETMSAGAKRLRLGVESPATANALDESIGAVAQLMLAAHGYYRDYCVDEAEDTFDMSRRGSDTGCDREQHEAAKRLRDALIRIGAL